MLDIATLFRPKKAEKQHDKYVKIQKSSVKRVKSHLKLYKKLYLNEIQSTIKNGALCLRLRFAVLALCLIVKSSAHEPGRKLFLFL